MKLNFYDYQRTDTHSMARANLKKNKDFSTSTNTASKYIPKRLHQLKSSLSDPNLLSKYTFECEHCDTRFT